LKINHSKRLTNTNLISGTALIVGIALFPLLFNFAMLRENCFGENCGLNRQAADKPKITFLNQEKALEQGVRPAAGNPEGPAR